MVKAFVEIDIRTISQWQEVEVQELNVRQEHVHLVCSIPPKLSVSDYMGMLNTGINSLLIIVLIVNI